MSTPKDTPLEIKRVTLSEKGFTYETFRLTGQIDGKRIRGQFKSREEAEGEKNRLQVAALNSAGAVRPVISRLSQAQIGG